VYGGSVGLAGGNGVDGTGGGGERTGDQSLLRERLRDGGEEVSCG
jgi:hypothetical protein